MSTVCLCIWTFKLWTFKLAFTCPIMKVSSIWGGTGFECRLVLEVCSSCSEYSPVQFSSVGQSCPTLWPHGLQHARPPCPSPTPGVYTDSCPLSWWCHPAISSSVIPFSSHLQSFPASGSFPMSQFFASGGQSIGVSASASVLPMNIQDWLCLTGWIVTSSPSSILVIFEKYT